MVDDAAVREQAQASAGAFTPAPRFCSRCGSPLGEGGACPACVAGAHTASPSLAEPTQPGIGSAIALYLIYLSTLTLWLLDPEEFWPILVISAVDAAVVLGWSLAHARDIWPLLVAPRGLRWYIGPMALAVATFVFATVSLELITAIPGAYEYLLVPMTLDAGYGWTGVVLLYCVHPAVIEELAFRGVILAVLMRVLSAREAVIASALLFMVIHLTVLGFVHLFVLGVLLGWLRVRSGSLVPCMLLHFVHNLLCVLTEPYLR